MAEAEAADIGQQADAQPAALRHDADIAGQLLRVADLLQIHGVALDRVQDAHAVGTAQRDAVLAADCGEAVLQQPPFLAALGEATIIDHRALYAALRRSGERIQHQPVSETKYGEVRRLWRLRDTRIAGPSEHRRVVRVDRKDRAGEADPVQRDDQPPPDR